MICRWSPCSVLVILLSEKFTAKAQTVGVGRQCPQRQVFLSFLLFGISHGRAKINRE